jgi:hypothetical protein
VGLTLLSVYTTRDVCTHTFVNVYDVHTHARSPPPDRFHGVNNHIGCFTSFPEGVLLETLVGRGASVHVFCSGLW